MRGADWKLVARDADVSTVGGVAATVGADSETAESGGVSDDVAARLQRFGDAPTE